MEKRSKSGMIVAGIVASVAAICVTLLLILGSQEIVTQLWEGLVYFFGGIVLPGTIVMLSRDRNNDGIPDVFQSKKTLEKKPKEDGDDDNG